MSHIQAARKETESQIVVYVPTEDTPREGAPYSAEDEKRFAGMIEAKLPEIEALAREHHITEAHFVPFRPVAEDADTSTGGPFLTCYAAKSVSDRSPGTQAFADAVTALTGVDLDTRKKGRAFTSDVERGGLNLVALNPPKEPQHRR